MSRSFCWGVSLVAALAMPMAPMAAPMAPVPAGLPATKPHTPAWQLTLTLNRSDVFLGSKVCLTETVPADSKVEVRSVYHTATRIGRYDPDAASMVRLAAKDYECVLMPLDFSYELAGTWCRSSTAELPHLTTRTRGIEFEFVPKRLGVYLIESTWVGREGKEFYGPPVVLSVNPPLDEKGRPIVKPEWLPGWEDDLVVG